MQYGNIIPTIYPTGVFIQSIEQTKTSPEAGGKNIITVTLTNHTQQRFEILNGAKGDTGDAAGIKEITASIDNGIGVPSVSVTSTGTGAEKTVHFDFKNLKGETGNVALAEEVKQHISRSVASANQYTDDAIGAIEQRIDTGDTNTLQAAEKHADQTVQAEAQTRAQGDADTLSSAKKYTDELLIKIFQNGYIQGPGMKSPLEDTALHFEGYSWYEVNYDGNFFRAKGRNAKVFSSKKLTKEQIKNGDYIFQDDEQEDAIRNISGFFEIYTYDGWGNFDDGKLFKVGKGRGKGESYQFAGSNVRVDFDASKIVPTDDNENRPRNLTFTYWVLVKN